MVASTQRSVAHPVIRTRSGAISFRRACRSVPANGSFRSLRTTTSPGSRNRSGRNAQPGVCGSKSSPLRPQCWTKITVPDCSRTLAASLLMRSMTLGKSYLGSPLKSPTCISTTSIASMRGRKKSGAVRFQAPVYLASKIKTTLGANKSRSCWHKVAAFGDSLVALYGRAAPMSRAQRLLDLIQALRGYRRPVSGATLAETLGISLRTVYRDIETLKAQGAHIDGEPGVGYVLRPGFMLPPLMFSEEEIEAIVLGSRWVAERADAELGAAARNALAKIAAVLPPDLKTSLDTSSLLIGPGKTIAAGDAELPVIRLAIRSERKLRIGYLDGNGRASKRTIWPFAVGFFDRARVVVAWCELREGFRHFRTDRISKVQVVDKRYPRRRPVLLKEWRAAEGIPES